MKLKLGTLIIFIFFIALAKILTVSAQLGEEIIIDNGTAGYSESPNDWITSSYSGSYGTTSRANHCNPSGDYATWQTVIPASGIWSASAWWTQGVGRVTDVKYRIFKGSTLLETKTVNQQLDGSKFNLLGNYYFGSGETAKVEILDISGGCACPSDPCTIGADAVKFTLLSQTTPTPGLAGDANGDGKVDDLDYVIWVNNYGMTNATGPRQGDFNADRRVDDLDYAIWVNNYNRSLPTSTPTPKPTVLPPTSTPYPTIPPPPGLRAFPGAEGFGSQTPGGRGGKVYEITNLNDSGTGSLRECVIATGARTCIFKVGGTLKLSSALTIRNPYITIAGQSAPGGGISITNSVHIDPIVDIVTHDVVIRYLTIRPKITRGTPDEFDALNIWTDNGRLQVYNIIIDHCSMSWGTDQITASWYAPHDFSMQWSIFAEGLDCSTHNKGCHSKGPMFGSYNYSESGGIGAGNISFHHNLMANSIERNPLMKPSLLADVVNNVTFQPFSTSGSGSYGYIDIQSPLTVMTQNWVGNFFKSIPGKPAEAAIKTQLVGGKGLQLYVQGNIGPTRQNSSVAESAIVESDSRQFIVSSRFTAPAITTQTCNSMTDCAVYNLVMSMAGNNQGLDANGNYYTRRDAVDKRILEGIKGTGGHWGKIIDAPGATTCKGACRGGAYVLTSADYTQFGITDPLDADGWPVITNGTAYPDSDHDGSSDNWEMAKFGNLTTSSNTSDYDSDGYTDLEEFLNASDPKIKN